MPLIVTDAMVEAACRAYAGHCVQYNHVDSCWRLWAPAMRQALEAALAVVDAPLVRAGEQARDALLRVQPQVRGALPLGDVQDAIRALDRVLPPAGGAA